MTREEAILWLKVISTREFAWDEYAMQESQREIRERCEDCVREALDMAIKALQTLEAVERIKTEVLPQTDLLRCKDCRHIYKNDFCSFYGCPTEADGYCNNGERREE